jgi:son of sevenless-like protein
VDLGNPDFTVDNNFINFDKRRKVAKIINELQAFQLLTHSLIEVPALRDFILNLGSNGWKDEKSMYAKSWQVEPKDETDEDENTE